MCVEGKYAKKIDTSNKCKDMGVDFTPSEKMWEPFGATANDARPVAKMEPKSSRLTIDARGEYPRSRGCQARTVSTPRLPANPDVQAVITIQGPVVSRMPDFASGPTSPTAIAAR